MADSKLTALTADTAPTGDDITYVVNDPGGTPASRKVTLTNLAGSAAFSSIYVAKTLADANSIIGATADDTPIAIAVAASQLVGRKATGNVGALTTAEVGALFAGTAFPGSPSDRQTFWRTDRDIQYFYDLANLQWLSTQEYVLSVPTGDNAIEVGITAASENAGRLAVPHRGTYSIYITRFQVMTLVNTTLDGTKYWTVKLNRASAADSDTQIGTTMDTSADTVGQNFDHFISPNVVLDSTARQLKMRVDKVSTPGPLFITGLLHYRLVG